MDPLNAIANLILGWHKTTKFFDLLWLIFQMSVSMIGAFLVITGGALVGGVNWPHAVGSGMIASATVLGYYVRRSPALKGRLFVFPEIEAELEIKQDVQVIQR